VRNRRRMYGVAMAAIALGLCLELPALAQHPVKPAPENVIHVVLMGGECVNCVQEQDGNPCDALCEMPMTAILTNTSDGLVVVEVTLSLSFRNDGLLCGNADESQTRTYTIPARGRIRVGFGHTFTGEFHKAVFASSLRLIVPPTWLGNSIDQEMEFDSIVPVCPGGEQ